MPAFGLKIVCFFARLCRRWLPALEIGTIELLLLTTGSVCQQGAIMIEKKVSCAPDMFHHLAAFTVAFFISLSPLDPTFGQLIPTISRLNVKRATVI